MTRYKLKNLRVGEIGLVDMGAGETVRIEIIKRLKTIEVDTMADKKLTAIIKTLLDVYKANGDGMSLDDAISDLPDDKKAVVMTAIASANSSAKMDGDDEDETEKAKKEAAEKAEAEKIAAAKAAGDDDDKDDLDKSDTDKAVDKAVEKVMKIQTVELKAVQKQLKDMEDKEEIQAFEKRAADLPFVPGISTPE